MTSEDGHLHLRKSNGLVRDVFHERHMLRLKGVWASPIPATRPPAPPCFESQPFYTIRPMDRAAHNGNLTNSRALKELLLKEDLAPLNTIPTRVLLNVFLTSCSG